MKKLILPLCIVSHALSISGMDRRMWLDMFGKLPSEYNDTAAMDSVEQDLNEKLIRTILAQRRTTTITPAPIINLIQQGANPTKALPYAIKHGQPDHVSLLLDNAARNADAQLCDRNINEKKQISLLSLAVNAHPNIMTTLLNHGIRADLSTYITVVDNCRFDNLISLIESGMHIDTEIDEDKNNALIKFCIQSSFMYPHLIIEKLVSKGANINHQNKLGNTALIAAVTGFLLRERVPPVVAMLLSLHANPYISNNEGKKALDYAYSAELKALIQAKMTGECCICMDDTIKTLSLLPCTNKHLDNPICSSCCTKIKAKTNLCPLCRKQLS